MAAGGKRLVRVLVIEDDGEPAGAIAAGLRMEGMAVDTALDGAAGLDRALVNDYDVIVLDRDLPVLHGDDVCGRLVAAVRAGSLMLTAAGRVPRLRALAGRSPPAVPPVLTAKGIPLAPARRVASRRGATLDLAAK